MSIILNNQPKYILVLLAALVAIAPLSIDMYLPSLPLIAANLNASEPQIQLTISAFLAGLTGGMLVYGPLSDHFGRRKLLLIGIVVYLLATMGCFIASSSDYLIKFRFLQGLGAAATSVLARAIVRDIYPITSAARILSIMHVTTMLTILTAPVIGGYLILAFGWRIVFGVLLIFGALCFISSYIFIAETKNINERSQSILKAMLGYIDVLRSLRSMSYILCMGFSFAGMFSFIAASPFIYIEFFQLSPQAYSWIFFINGLGIISVTLLNSKLVFRFGSKKMLLAGAVITLISSIGFFICIALVQYPLFLGSVLSFLSISVTGMLGANCLANLLTEFREQSGAAAGLAIAVQFGLGALFSALVSSLQDGTPTPMYWMMVLTGVCCSLFAGCSLIDKK